MFKQYYSGSFYELFGTPPKPEEGLGDDATRAELGRFGLVIPIALFDYYSLAGHHWINDDHNRLRPIERLEWIGDKLIFMDENQGVAVWGLCKADLREADPLVWQGVDGDPIEWYPEDDTLSRFVVSMWRWTITGEDEPPGSDQPE